MPTSDAALPSRVDMPPRPCSSAIIWSTGPPGANWMTTKLIAMMPNRVGITSSRRRKIGGHWCPAHLSRDCGAAGAQARAARVCASGTALGRVGRGGFRLVHPPAVEVEPLADWLVGVAEAVPIGDVEHQVVPVRYHVPAPQQDPVQRTRRRLQVGRSSAATTFSISASIAGSHTPDTFSCPAPWPRRKTSSRAAPGPARRPRRRS